MRLLLAIVLLSYMGFTWWFTDAIEATGQQIEFYQEELAKPPPTPVAIIRFDGVKPGLVVPSWPRTDDDQIWAYVGPDKAVDVSYVPELTELSVAHGEGWMYTSQVRPDVDKALAELFEEASSAGFPLIVTSAYRSAIDQDRLYQQSQANYGTIWAGQHIAEVGHSEHQLGLSVDLSRYSTSCQLAFANCYLDEATALWLVDNAPSFGFILRYPADKVAITGIAHEPWHFRYVGVDMARYIKLSGLTFDEISQRLITERGK